MQTPFLFIVLMFFSATGLSQERIISAGASVTELLLALEAEDQLVAVDLTSRTLIDNPNLPQVGYHRQLSAEGLMSLNPTRLIGSDEMGPDTTLSLLKASNVDVVITPTGHGVDDLYRRIDMLAAITHKEANAAPLKKQITTALARLNDSAHSGPHPKVMFLLLNTGRPMSVAGKNTVADNIIRLSGAINPAASQFTSYKTISTEALLTLQPDYILVAERSVRAAGGLDNLLAQHPLLATTPAAIHHRVIAIPGTALVGGFGLQSLKLAETLNQRFHSEP